MRVRGLVGLSRYGIRCGAGGLGLAVVLKVEVTDRRKTFLLGQGRYAGMTIRMVLGMLNVSMGYWMAAGGSWYGCVHDLRRQRRHATGSRGCKYIPLVRSSGFVTANQLEQMSRSGCLTSYNRVPKSTTVVRCAPLIAIIG